MLPKGATKILYHRNLGVNLTPRGVPMMALRYVISLITFENIESYIVCQQHFSHFPQIFPSFSVVCLSVFAKWKAISSLKTIHTRPMTKTTTSTTQTQ